VLKLKIGISGTRGIPNRYGGFEQFTEHLSTGLVQKGHEVYVYSPHDHPYQKKIWNGVNILHCKDPEQKLGTIGQFFYDRSCNLDAQKRNFDILLHLGYTSDAIWHRLWPKNAINIVNMDGLEWKRSKYNWLTKRFLKYSEALAAQKADALIADSMGIQEHLLKCYNKRATYIPYGATIFDNPQQTVIEDFGLIPHQYFLVIARMEPENNIEMIIKGFLSSGHNFPLLIIGDTNNRYGKYLTRKYNNQAIKFIGSVYDAVALDNLRFFCSRYFHGHSVGGTNPSLLEAMACGCSIAAHDNIFNRSILENSGSYFVHEKEVASILQSGTNSAMSEEFRYSNLQKIRTIYNYDLVIDAYEELMLKLLPSPEKI
jgi:glycosyltransferase involved in cell wall biosynthesis